MPVYNCELFLHDSISSILNQSYRNFEFIIINDGSNDSSLEIIKSYAFSDNRIKIIDQRNKGLIESLNLGISISKGKYIARMDADDISLVNRFEMQLSYMIKNNIDICGCHYYIINESNHYKNAIIEPIDSDDISLRLSTSVPFAHGSVMIKKSLFDAHKYGQTPFKSVEDYALWIKFKNQGYIFGNVDEFLFKYREYSQSFSNTKKSKMESERRKLSRNYLKNNTKSLKISINNKLKHIIDNNSQYDLLFNSFILRHKLFKLLKLCNNRNKLLLVGKLSKLFLKPN